MNLKVKGTYLFEDGKPFFWLGDTAWLLFEKLTSEQIEYYLSDRAEKGFNVVQATVLHTPLCAQKADREYFNKILGAVEYAKTKGIYLALLPCWGYLVKSEIVNNGNIERYARFLGKTFKNCENIVWVLGGDIRGSVNFNLYCTLATILKEYNPERLITFHPFGRTGSFNWFNGCDWLDFNMFQSGHRRYGQAGKESVREDEHDYAEDNYKYVLEAHALTPLKPVLDAEPSYESIVQGLHDFTQPYWRASDVRRYAYWSVFAGACGFTYGHNAVMQFHSEGDADANYGVRENWRDALSAEGAGQMKYLKALMLSVDFTGGRRRDDLVTDNGERYGHTACFAGGDFALLYNYEGGTIRLKPPFTGECAAYLFNPTNGQKTLMGNYDCNGELVFPARDNKDRLIILKKL